MATQWNTETFRKKVKEINPDFYVVGPYIGYHKKILVRCNKHNVAWMTYPKSLIGGHGCPNCAKVSRQKAFSKTHEQFVVEIAEKDPNIEILGQYKNARTKIKCRCKIDGYIWNVIPDALSRGQGCPKCRGGALKSQKQFIDELHEINPYIEVLGKYINTDTKIRCKCLRDGNVWLAVPKQLLRGVGCPRCKQSHGEREVELFLAQNKFQYIREYRFDDCRDKQPLPFDFYLPDINTCIEYDGQQHYKPFDRWGGDVALRGTKRRDSIKTNYCKAKGIRLIRIPYTVNDINKFLKQQLGI